MPKQIASNDFSDGSGTVLGGLGLNASVKSLASAKDGSIVTCGSAEAVQDPTKLLLPPTTTSIS
jgi:hypothetical protein